MKVSAGVTYKNLTHSIWLGLGTGSVSLLLLVLATGCGATASQSANPAAGASSGSSNIASSGSSSSSSSSASGSSSSGSSSSGSSASTGSSSTSGSSSSSGSTSSGSTSGGSSTSGSTTAIVPNAPITGYHLTFDDEFNDLSVSNDPYLYKTLWCSCAWWYPGSGTQNMQVQNGMLQMSVTQDGQGGWIPSHISTWSPTTHGFAQKFGYWEIRFKPSGQQGILDDFYLISEDNILTNGAYPSNEMDIYEKPAGNIIYMTLHEGDSDGYAFRYDQVPVAENFDQNFHTIGLLWEEDSGYIQWYIDGKLAWQQPKYNDTDMSRMVMTVESTVNGVFGGPDSTTHFPATTLVDYVRVFSNDPTLPLWTVQ